MPKTPAAEVVAGDRAVRVSSPDRVIYEATDRTPEVTKLMVAEYFASVGDAVDPAAAQRLRRTLRTNRRHYRELRMAEGETP